jgi:hypothetical protein
MLVCNVEETLYGNLHFNKRNGFDATEVAVWKEVQKDAWSRSVAKAVCKHSIYGDY